MTQPILTCSGVGHDYGSFRAVGQVDLALAPNGIHSLIGPNGAGKTTFFNVISGRLTASRGQMVFSGRDITRSPAPERIRLGMARSFQITSLFRADTVRHNLRLAALGAQASQQRVCWRRWSPQADERIEALLRMLELEAFSERTVESLSHGLQRVLEIGMCLVPRPRALLLDEPLAGLGLSDIPRVAQLLQALSKDHAILLVEHNMRVVMSISDRITVMFQGNVLAQGTADEVRRNEDVRRVYLGTQSER